MTTPTVQRLASKYGMSEQQAEQAQRQMEERAAGDGLVFRMDGLRSGNTRDAHRLLQLAKARHRQPELLERLHSAYFTEQDSIFDHDALAELAVEDRPRRRRGRAPSSKATATAPRSTPTRPWPAPSA